MKDAEQQLKDDIKELKHKLQDDGHKVKGKKKSHFDMKKVVLYSLPFIIIIIFIVGFLAGTNFSETPPSEPVTHSPPDDTSGEEIIPVLEENDTVEENDSTIEIVFDEHGCFDSDGGSFPFEVGYVIDAAGNEHEDYCDNSILLKEAYCGPLGYKASKNIQCEYGCSEGACIEGADTQDSEDCFDSDGGSFPNEAGYVIDKSNERFDDECSSTTVLKEVRCGIADYVAVSTISCDFKCEDGACVEGIKEPEPECFDSDAANEFTSGYVTDISGERTDDTCLNAFTVKEGRCNPFGYYNGIYIDCEHGCLDGVCLQG